MKKVCFKALSVLSLAFTLAVLSCEQLDVVGTGSVKSFDLVLQRQGAAADAVNGGWSLTAPDRSVRFIWSRNFASSPLYDVMLEIDGAPFIRAGLNPEKLTGNFSLRNGKLLVGAKLGDEELKYEGEVTPLASYQQIVKLKRNAIGYHGAMDHYGVSLGGGSLFEWARDMGANDKDIVFVLEPGPLIAAGVRPENIEGWVFTKVMVDDDNGKPVEVDKILKPFDLP